MVKKLLKNNSKGKKNSEGIIEREDQWYKSYKKKFKNLGFPKYWN